MGKVFSSLMGGDDQSTKIAEQSQRQALAAMANQQAEVDQAAATSTGRKGRRLLTALGAPGVAKLGG